jgi:hypothetical protein
VGVQTHVIAQKKETVLHFKTPFADWRGLAPIFPETVVSGTIFHYRKIEFSSNFSSAEV